MKPRRAAMGGAKLCHARGHLLPNPLRYCLSVDTSCHASELANARTDRYKVPAAACTERFGLPRAPGQRRGRGCMRTFYWDFFGPRAEGTAQHFVRHLEEFLAKHELEGCTVGTRSEQEGHMAALCQVTEALEAVLEKALRPNRRDP